MAQPSQNTELGQETRGPGFGVFCEGLRGFPVRTPYPHALSPFQFGFEIPEGAAVSVFSGHRGVLAIDGEHSYVIDITETVQDPDVWDYDIDIDLLLRRVKTG